VVAIGGSILPPDLNRLRAFAGEGLELVGKLARWEVAVPALGGSVLGAPSGEVGGLAALGAGEGSAS